MVRAVGLIRVSTTEQAQEGVSLGAQAAKIRAYANLHDLELVDVIADAGKSGKTMERDGLQHAIAMVESGEVQALIVAKLDRLSRRTVDTLHLIERIEAAGAAFHSIQERIDTKSAIGKFFLTITAAFASFERDLIAERTTECLAFKKAQGEHVGRAPFGYRIEGKVLVADEAQAWIVRLIMDLRNHGKTFRAIADELNDMGIPTQRGGRWQPQTVSNILGRATA